MRHAAAELAPDQRAGDLFSTGNYALSGKGRRQAEAARDRLRAAPIDGVVASPSKRCQETARIVAEPHGLEVSADARLLEFPVGLVGEPYESMLEQILELPSRLAAERDPTLGDGTRWSENVARFDAAIRDTISRYRFPLVVAHGIANRAWLASRSGTPPPELLLIEMEHAQVVEVEL